MSIGLSLLVVALLVCAFISLKSKKTISKTVTLVLIALIPPVIGNLFIIASPIKPLSLVGCYTYYIGMDLVIYALLKYSFKYCGIKFNKKLLFIPIILYTILVADGLQLFLNIWFHHAFTIELIEAYGGEYYSLVPYVGQTIHRIVEIRVVNGETRYITQGDANKGVDSGYRVDSDIQGLVNLRIKYIGLPTLWLSSLFK